MSIESAMGNGLAKQVAAEIKKIGDLLWSFTNDGKVKEAVDGNFRQLREFLEQYVYHIESEFKRRTGRDIGDSDPQEVNGFLRRLAGATFEVADETDPNRIRMLAAAVAGCTWGRTEDDYQSAAWHAIKKLPPGAIHFMAACCKDEEWSELGVGSDKPEYEPSEEATAWEAALIGAGCATRYNYDGAGGGPYPDLTLIGRTVLEILKPFVSEVVSENT